VTWIWLGAMIIAVGGLIALWPVPELGRRRRVRLPDPITTTPAPPPAVPVREGAAALATREPV
jgi:hypothetical protein